MHLEAMTIQGMLVQAIPVQAMAIQAIPHQGGHTRFRDIIIVVLLVVIAKLVFFS
jgi:hypothetical protein